MFTSNIQKGGALLEDSRRMVEAWDPSLPSEANLERIVRENLLGKPSRARAEDVLLRILKPRFVDPGDHVLVALKRLVRRPGSFTEACYYEATRDDQLLAAFVEGPLWDWWTAGRLTVRTDDAVAWVAATSAAEGAGWSQEVQRRIARGLLAALRDFGILRGSSKKEIAAPSMTPAGFAYVAWREHERGSSARQLVTSKIWRRWLLDDDHVIQLFGQVARTGALRLSQAGSAIRLDWLVDNLEELIDVAA